MPSISFALSLLLCVSTALVGSTVVAAEPGSVSGRVTDGASGLPLAGVLVSALALDDGNPGPVQDTRTFADVCSP